MANLALVFDVLAKDQASSKFRDIGNAADRAGKQTSTFGSTVASGMKIAAGALLGSGLIAGFKALYEAADESRKISALTTQVIKTTGGAANVSAKQVGDLAGAIAKKTGVDDEAIQSGQNLLLTFMNVRNEVGKGNDIFNRATETITDMSVALGQDTTASATQLGKALNDPIRGVTALQRVGVSFTASQREQIKVLVESGQTLEAQKIILDELGKEFGGAAEAAATPLDKLRQRAGDLAEQVGAYLIPAVDKFATFAADKLLPALQDIGSFLNAVAVPAFKLIGTVVGTVADIFNSLPGPLQAAVIALGAFAVLRGPLTSAFETIGLRALYMKDAIVSSGTGMGALKTAGTGVIGFLGGPWGLAFAGAVTGVSLLASWLGKNNQATEAAAGFQRNLTAALKESNGVIDENVRALAAKQAAEQEVGDSDLLGVAEDLGISLPRVTDALLGNRDAYNELRGAANAYIDQALLAENAGDMEFTTNAENARLFIAALDALAPTAERAAEDNRRVAEATGEVGAAAVGSGAGVADFSARIEAARGELDEGKRAIDDFKFALDLLTGANVSAIELEAAFQDAVASATGAMTEMGGEVLQANGALNLQSENGRKAADVLLDVRNSANDYIATMIEQGATTDQVAAKDAELRASFIHTANQMGITGQNAETLADQILGVPADRHTEFTDNTGAAGGRIANLQQQIDNLRGKDVFINVRADHSVGRFFVNPQGGHQEFWSGGFTGDGGKFEPKGVVHGGEFVFTKEETSKAGVGNLRAMAQSLRGYAAGGFVPISVNFADRGASSVIDSATAAVKKMLEPGTQALAWAKSQVGKPYLWGGVGPGGYDCSGFMSAIANVLQGRSPHSRRGSTASFPWPGFASGFGGIFTIGSTRNAGNGIGHMAGTLAGMNVESSGGVGVRVGGGARGAGSSLFNQRAHLASYGDGTNWVPESGLAYVHRGEAIVPASQNQGAPYAGLTGIEVTGRLEFDEAGVLRLVDGLIVQAFTENMNRGNFNG